MLHGMHKERRNPNQERMKRLIIISLTLVFLAGACRSGKDNNIYIDHSKEKNQFQKKSNKKYKR